MLSEININHMEATLTLVTFKIGMMLFIVGLLFIMFPPKNINSFYGYRTTNSRRNLDTWKVANSYSAILMAIEGLILAVIGLLTTFFNDNKAIETALGIGLMFFSFIILVVATEKHLNKLFDEDGNRKI
jgi:uncharacterized membrane protein